MPVVAIPDVGEVEFPDSMSAGDIESSARNLHAQAQTPLTDQQFSTLGQKFKVQNEQDAMLHEMNAHDADFLSAVANDPKGFAKAIPSIAMGAAMIPGKLTYEAVVDAVAKLDRARGAEYGGNLSNERPWESLPAEKFLASTAQDFPFTTTTAKVGKSLTEMAPLGAAGLLPATAQKLLAAGFSAQMLAGAPQQFKDFAEEYYKPKAEQDPDKLTSLWSDVIQTGVFAPLAGAGASGLAKVPQAVRLAGELARNDMAGRSRYESAAPTGLGSARATRADEAPSPNPEVPGGAPGTTRGARVVPTVPESPATLEAQVKLTADAQSSKAATHVTPGEAMPTVPDGLVTVELPENKGTLIVNPAKAEPVEVAKAAMEEAHGKYLGMGSESKPSGGKGAEGKGGEVLQTKDAAGAVVQDEVVTPETLPAAKAAAAQLAPNGASEVKPAEQVLAERKAIYGDKFTPEQLADMATLNSADQMAKYGTTRAKLMGEAALKSFAGRESAGQIDRSATPPERPAETTPAAGTLPAETGAGRGRRAPVAAAKPGAVAQEKMQAQVSNVARTEGPRPAKEIKSELVQRIEQAMDSAPAPSEKQQKALAAQPRPVRPQSAPGYTGNGRPGEMIAGIKWADAEILRRHAEWVAEVEKAGLKRVTIDIPGDGEFKVWNTKEHLAEMLKRAKRLETNAGRPQPARTNGMSAEDAAWVREEIARAKAEANPTSSYYYFDSDLKKFVPTSGEPVELPFGDYFVSKRPTGWRVTDVRSGLAVSAAEKSKAKAIESARQRISGSGEARVTEVRAAALKDTGESPRTVRHIAGFGGSPRPPVPRRTTPLPVPSALPPAPPPTRGLRAALTQRRIGFQSVFAPGSIDAGARAVANSMRELLGQQAIALARAEEAMQSYRREFDHTPVARDYVYDPSQPLPHNYAVMDAFETNRAALPPRYADLAKTFDEEFAWRIKKIQKFAPQALRHLITNYFPHVWKDPVRAADVMNQIATRLFAGRKEFLKQRTLPIFVEGLARGLEPISDNPVDLLLAKMHSMDKFITNLRFQAEWREAGALKFKYIFEHLPDGWKIEDDPAFTVIKPPIVTVKEAVDDFARAKLGELLTHLGVSYQRVASLGGRRWAEAERGTKEIRARVGATEDVLWHEVGHHLDWQFPDLRNSLTFRGKGNIAEQLRALVDLNHPGVPHNPKLHYHKYLRKTEEKMAEIFRAYVHAPDLFRGSAPDVWSVVHGWLNKHPDIRSRLDAIRPGMKLGEETTDIKLGGMLTLGHWIMPDGAHAVIHNYLSPGLAHSGIYRSLRAASNVLNGAQLGFSAFHLGFTSLDAAVSRASVGLEALFAGKPVDAAMKLASTPLAPITNLIAGARIRTEMLHPGTSPDVQVQQMAKLAVTGGLRATVDPFYKTEFTRKFVRALSEERKQWAMFESADVRLISSAPFAALEQTLRPILEYIVPRQKLGVFADMARLALDKLGPMATHEQIREAMARAADSTENRMGQMTYDNLFYHKAVKDLALLSFRAYGWQLGKYREAFGAVSDTARALNDAAHFRKPEFTHRMAYAITLPLVVGALGALMNKLWTGENPSDTRDYFFPRTGKLDAGGRPQRVALPSYMKDLVSDWHDFPNIKKMGASFYHKLNPLIGVTVDMLRNRDFYDVEIYHEDDPGLKPLRDALGYALASAKPFSVSGAMKLRDDSNAGAQEFVLPFFGIVPAKKALSMTAAESKAADIIHDLMPVGTRTQSEADKSKVIAKLTRTLQEDRQLGAQQIRAAARAGVINANDVDRAIGASLMTPLGYQVQRMPVESALKVWDLANDEERSRLADVLLVKIANAQNLDPALARQRVKVIKTWKEKAGK